MTLQTAQNGLDVRSQGRDSCLKHSPQDIPFHIEIVVNQNVSHTDDGAPWHCMMSISKSCAQLVSGLANDLHLRAEEPTEHLVLKKPRVILPRMTLDCINCLNDVAEPLLVAAGRFHTATASRKTFSLKCGRMSLCSEITSTVQPRRSRRSMSSSPISKRLLPSSIFTSTSTSLVSSSSPRATEPKIRTSVAPCFAARARMASRCFATNSRFFTSLS